MNIGRVFLISTCWTVAIVAIFMFHRCRMNWIGIDLQIIDVLFGHTTNTIAKAFFDIDQHSTTKLARIWMTIEKVGMIELMNNIAHKILSVVLKGEAQTDERGSSFINEIQVVERKR